MGVVFGLFAGFYYWFDILIGSKFSEEYGKIHFWLTFVGVNLTFFPQHFLGLAGMPRRIPDYPDVYYGWNYISSLGSLITVIGLGVFCYTVIASIYAWNLFMQKNNSFYLICNSYEPKYIHSLLHWYYRGFDNLRDRMIRFLRLFGFFLPNKLYIFPKYNLFHTIPNNDIMYIYIDRYLLSIFLYNFSNIWLIDTFFNKIFNSVNKTNRQLFSPLRVLFNLNNNKNPLISCFIFLFKGWLSLFVYCIYLYSFKQIKLLFKIQLLNIVFFKFLGIKNNTDNLLFLLLKKVNILQKISLFL